VEIGEARAFVVQAIEVGRLEDGIAVGGDIAVALVVGEDEEDVGTFARERIGAEMRGEKEQEQEEAGEHGEQESARGKGGKRESGSLRVRKGTSLMREARRIRLCNASRRGFHGARFQSFPHVERFFALTQFACGVES
jgi:hypothetical protein